LNKTRPRILIVDDDPDFREILSRLLDHEGYQVVVSASGLGAIRHLASKTPPRAIVLDLRMPRLDGWAFLRVIRALGLSRSIPVIIVSAYVDEKPMPKKGVAAALSKPVDLNRVIAVVRTAVKNAA
jgi:CheY-like chemotaxis protein